MKHYVCKAIIVAFIAVIGFLGPMTEKSHAVLILAGNGGAASDFGTDFSLAELILAGSFIQIDNTLFDNFTFNGNTTDTQLIKVLPLGELGPATPGTGLSFAGTFAVDDWELDYDVSTVDGTTSLKDWSLSLIGGIGQSFQAVEMVDIGGNEIATPEPTLDIISPNQANNFIDEFSLLAVNSKAFSVTANAMVLAAGDVTGFTHSFSRLGGAVPQPDPVPEPATIALLGIGLVGLAGAEVRRRRKKKAVDNS